MANLVVGMEDGDLQDEKQLLELGDTLPEMLKANQAFASAAAAVIDCAKALLDSHADNGAVRRCALLTAATYLCHTVHSALPEIGWALPPGFACLLCSCCTQHSSHALRRSALAFHQ